MTRQNNSEGHITKHKGPIDRNLAQLLKHIFRTLALYRPRFGHHLCEVLLEAAMLFPLGRRTSGHFHWNDPRPMHHGLGKQEPRPLKARRPLYGVNLERRLPQLLHKAGVGVRNGLGRPQADTEVLHGQLRHLMHLH